MNPLQAFGLAADADERALKREYAKRLKQTRPEEDPQGFQRLHAKYEAALAWLAATPRPQASAAGQLAPDPVSETTDLRDHDCTPLMSIKVQLPEWAANVRVPTAAAPPARAEFDADAFFDGFLAKCNSDDENAMRAWLNAEPALWQLDRKAAIGRWLVNRLIDVQPGVHLDVFDEMLRFFGYDHITNVSDAAVLMRLRARLHLRWRLLDSRAFAKGARATFGERDSYVLRQRRQILKPFRPVQAVLSAIFLLRPSKMRNFLLRIDGGRLDLPPPVIPEQVRFWMDASDSTRARWPRLAIGYAWSLMFVWFITLFVSMILHEDDWTRGTLQDLAWSPLWAGAMFGTWVFLTVPVRWYLEWHGAPGHVDVPHRGLRTACVPILLLVASVTAYSFGYPWLLLFAPLALSTAWVGMRAGKSTTQIRFDPGPVHLLGAFFMAALAPASLTVAGLCWLADVVNRQSLRIRMA